MENISWSEEQVLSVVKEFNDAMEGICIKYPDFQHAYFVKIALLYLKRENVTSEWQLTGTNGRATKILQHLEYDTSDINSEQNVNGIELKKAIKGIYNETIGRIPYDVFVKNYLKCMIDTLNYNTRYYSRGPLWSYFETNFIRPEVDYKNIYVKGEATLSSLMSEKREKFWNNTITCDFEDLDDLYIFEMEYEGFDINESGTTLFINSTNNNKSSKYDVYLDHAFDFSKASSILEKLNPDGYIIAGVTETEIDGRNTYLRKLFDNGQIKRVHYVDVEDSDWVEIVPQKGNANDFVCFYDPWNELMSHEIAKETIVKCGYSLDLAKYDAFEKLDEYLAIMDRLREAYPESAVGYEVIMALRFIIPYFKKNYNHELLAIFEEDDPDYKILTDKIIDNDDRGDAPEIVTVVQSMEYCVDIFRTKEWITDANYQQMLNAIRMIDTIEDSAFQSYYPEIIERICTNVVRPSYITLYEFIESQLNNIDDLKIVIRKDDLGDINYRGDGFSYGLNEGVSFTGWGTLISNKGLRSNDIDVEMDFQVINHNSSYDPICSAAQYVILDAFNKSVLDIKYQDEASQGGTEIIIDLHKDVRQYEQLSKKRLNPGGRYVTFAMKKDMEDCQPVIEHLIKENLLEKVVSLNNRYLLFISQSKQDDKVVLAKFNHVDDDRWLQSYQTIIDELALNADSKHVRILSSKDLAATNYSISTDSYFAAVDSHSVESVIHSLIARHNLEYNAIDILLYILSRVGHLHRYGEDFPYFSKTIEKLDGVYESMRDYEELLMDNYTECVNTVIQIYGSEVFAHEHFQPGISKLMVDILSPDSIHNVYNPFAGLASFCYLLPKADYFGSEIDENVFTFAAYRLEANGLYDQAMFECRDSTIDDADDVAPFDTILTILPFMIKNETRLCDYLFGKCFSMLEENGKMMVALPSKFTFDKSPAMTELRKKIVENKWVEKVICLPKGAFTGTNVNTCLIQLSKRANQEILFCDATQMVEYDKGKGTIQMEAIVSAINQEESSCCFRIANSAVLENNYSLNLFVYKPFPSEEGTIQCRLNNFLTEIKRTPALSLPEGLLFTQDMLSSDVVNYRKGLDDLKTGGVSVSMMKLQGDALIVSSVQGSLKPTYMEIGEDTCYYMNRSLLAFKVDTSKVLPGYICHALTQPEILKQIDNYRIGTLAKISSDDFLNVRINLPDLSAQRAIVDDLTREHYTKKKQELNKMYGDVYAEKEEEFKSLKHAMGKSVAGITAAVDNLYKYFEGKGQLDTIVHERRSSTLGDKLNVIQQSVQHIAVLLKHGADFLDVSQYPIESVSIDDLWRCITYETNRFSLSKSNVLEDSIKRMTIRMNVDLFKILVNDILSNAEKHAFEDSNPINTVRVEYVCDNSWFTLFVSNNGRPFPDDVDVKKFTKRYWSAGNHQGSGIGGHDILKIMTAFQGEFELLTDYEDSYPTCYVLRFPVE